MLVLAQVPLAPRRTSHSRDAVGDVLTIAS